MTLEKKKPTVFVIMPFEEGFFEVFDFLKESFKEEYEFNRAGDMRNHGNILKDIVQSLQKADVVLADLTELNSNVFYELGIAHTMERKVVMITQSIKKLPFDIQQYKIVPYSIRGRQGEKFLETLKFIFEGAINKTINFGNPVRDFIDNASTSNVGNTTSYSNTDTDKIIQKNLSNFIEHSFALKFELKTLSQEQKNTISEWVQEWKPEMIDRAINITLEAINYKEVFEPILYMNGILKKWKNNDINNLEDIRPVY